RLDPVPVTEELERAKEGLGNLYACELIRDHAGGVRVTLKGIEEKLRQRPGFDILYLVCHGALLGEQTGGRPGPNTLLGEAEGGAAGTGLRASPGGPVCPTCHTRPGLWSWPPARAPARGRAPSPRAATMGPWPPWARAWPKLASRRCSPCRATSP